eukprot:UN00520
MKWKSGIGTKYPNQKYSERKYPKKFSSTFSSYPQRNDENSVAS